MRLDTYQKAHEVLTGHLAHAVTKTNAHALARGLDGTEMTAQQRVDLTKLWADVMAAAEPMALALTQLVQQAATFIGTDETRSFASNAETMRAALAASDRAGRLAREREADIEWSHAPRPA